MIRIEGTDRTFKRMTDARAFAIDMILSDPDLESVTVENMTTKEKGTVRYESTTERFVWAISRFRITPLTRDGRTVRLTRRTV